MYSQLTPGQMKAIQVTERLTSVLSLLGTGFIILTFLGSRAFHKPINRLVFYACFGNIMANVATLMSTNGIEAGPASPLCQFQAFLIQQFMPADGLWTLAMACNVYLTFFRKYNAAQLRAMEWKYMIFCYGLPVTPAIVFLFVRSAGGDRVYGPATLWCWVSLEWDFLRVATFYGPVWVVMIITMTIYIFAGREIFTKRCQLRQFRFSHAHAPAIIENPYPNSKTTEICITSEQMNSTEPSASENSFADEKGGAESCVDEVSSVTGYEKYSVTIESGLGGSLAAHGVPRVQRSTTAMEANRAAWTYARVAFLFFIAMLVTWVPSSVNRVYTLVHPNRTCFALSYVSSLVLPLQGFWNFVVYTSTSLPACRGLFRNIFHIDPPPPSEADECYAYPTMRCRTPSADRKRISDISTVEVEDAWS
ncbi:MAG: hypothetical protein M1833_000618 [Piccolia ochrophora]|nr:MAG: hypothetical protein M1833_000618 [Piccolia ochrophora]